MANEGLRRLLAPRHIAVFGGKAAAEVIRQCRALGYTGAVWPVHPQRTSIAGETCFPDIGALPQAPDASFIAVPAEATVDVVAQLALRGAGGAVCYASGFAEMEGHGLELQQRLVHNAGTMAVLGPNCYGALNYLDGVALWPDQHGGQRLARGVAIVTQSGNIGLNLTMQRRALPLAMLVTLGNQAGASVEDVVDTLLDDTRISAIGLHIESLRDVAKFSRVALRALAQGVPLVALKAGSSELGARTTRSHTSAIAGPDALYDALFARCGVARVPDPVALLETLKLLHVLGPLAGRRIVSASCSGGEASLVADLAQPRGLTMPALPTDAYEALHATLGDKVAVANPLDYHTWIWGHAEAQTACFSGLLRCAFDAHLLVLDFPRPDRCNGQDWQTTVDAFCAAAAQHPQAPAAVVASLPEAMPESVAHELLARGIAPMQGLAECLDAIERAAFIGDARRQCAELPPLPLPCTPPIANPQAAVTWDEASSKQLLARHGVRLPRACVVPADTVAAAAEAIGYPVVLKAVSAALIHKSEAGAVQLGIRDARHLQQALDAMRPLSDQFLVEEMVQGAVAEILVGVQHDAQFGLTLTLGAGGVLVELLSDAATLLLPAPRADVLRALQGLRIWPLLTGFRGRPAGDVDALLDTIAAICACAESQAAHLLELDVNPLLLLPRRQGVIAVDAVLRSTLQHA